MALCDLAGGPDAVDIGRGSRWHAVPRIVLVVAARVLPAAEEERGLTALAGVLRLFRPGPPSSQERRFSASLRLLRLLSTRPASTRDEQRRLAPDIGAL